MELRETLLDNVFEEADYRRLSGDRHDWPLTLFNSAANGLDAHSIGGTRLMTNSGATTPGSDVTVPENDSDITVDRRSIQNADRTIDCYVARPASGGLAPGLLVIHENRGLTPHIRDVARRYAKLGYVAFAPDLLTPLGGADSFADAAAQIAAFSSRDRAEMMSDLRAGLDELAGLEGVRSDRLGVTGFCVGGRMTWLIATTDQRLRAAVPFYGHIPPLEDVPNITAAVLGIYGELDVDITSEAPVIERAMEEAGKVFEKEIYPGAQHQFHNDTSDRYNPDAARAAWLRATTWFDRWLKD